MPLLNQTPLDVAASIDRVLNRNINFPRRAVNVDTILTETDYMVDVDASGGVRTITFPDAATVKRGMLFEVKKTDASPNTVVVNAFGGQMIDGAAAQVLSDQWSNIVVYSDGANYRIYASSLGGGAGTVTNLTLLKKDIAYIGGAEGFGAIADVTGVVLSFNLAVAGVVQFAASGASLANPFIQGNYLGLAINVNGVDYYLNGTGPQGFNTVGGGNLVVSGFTSGDAISGVLALDLPAGAYTIKLRAFGNGYLLSSAEFPTRLSAVYPGVTGPLASAAALIKQDSGPFSDTVNPVGTEWRVVPGSQRTVVLLASQTIVMSAYTNFNDPGSNSVRGQLGIRVTAPGPVETDYEGSIARGGNDVNAACSTITRAVTLPAGTYTFDLITRNPDAGGSYEFENAWLTLVYNEPTAVAATPEAATLVVHPTAGKGDFQTIEAALAAIAVLGGGYLLVREGTYTPPPGGYQMPNVPVVVRGCGNATIIDLGSAADAAFVVPDGIALGTQYVFEDFEVRGDGVTVGQRAFAYNESDSNAWVTINRVFVNKTLETILDIQNYDQTQARWLRIKFNDCILLPTTLATSTLIKCVNPAGNMTGGIIATFNSCVLRNQFDLSTFSEFWGMDAPVDLVLNQTTVTFPAGTATNGFSVTDSDVNILGGDLTIFGGVVEASHITDTTVFGLDFNTFLPSRIIFKGDFQPFVCEGTVFSVTTLRLDAAAGPDPRRIVGCYFPGAATATMALDIQTSLVRIEGCEFGDPFGSHTAQAILLNDAFDCTIQGCGFEETGGVATVVETGTTDRTRIDDCPGLLNGAGPTLIGPGTTVNGTMKASAAAASTDALVTVVPTIRNPLGLSGSGKIKNTDGANSLDVKESFTDAFGVTSSLTTTVAAGGVKKLNLADDIGTGSSPYVSYKVEVQSTVAGTPATYEINFTSQGAM